MSDWNEADIKSAAERFRRFARHKYEISNSDAVEAVLCVIRSLNRPADQDGWMPIESAPKDGTNILVFVEDEYCIEAWWDAEQKNFYKSQFGWASYDPENARGDWVAHHADRDGDSRLYCGSTPKFWRPLPSAPTPETK